MFRMSANTAWLISILITGPAWPALSLSDPGPLNGPSGNEPVPVLLVPHDNLPATKLRDNLAVVVHGCCVTDPVWPTTMADSIGSFLGAGADWEIWSYNWSGENGVFSSLANGQSLGTDLGVHLGTLGYQHIHFMAHSAGSMLIEEATDELSSISIHQTFLDADNRGAGSPYSEIFGDSATFADHYYESNDSSLVSFFTNEELPEADSGSLDNPDFDQFDIGDPAHPTHQWPREWYDMTISDPEAFLCGQPCGFRLSKEFADKNGGVWPLPDFNNDNVVDDLDIDLLRNAIISATSDPIFDVDGLDGNIPTESDFDFLIENVIGTVRGDGDLDKTINFDDFVFVANNFNLTNSNWNEGNFNLDGVTNFEDFVELSNRFGLSCPCTSDGAPTPEPSAAVLLAAGGLCCGFGSRSGGEARSGNHKKEQHIRFRNNLIRDERRAEAV